MNSRKTFKYPLFFRFGKALTAHHIEKRRYPRINLVDILSARPAAAGKLENNIILRNEFAFSYFNHRNIPKPRYLFHFFGAQPVNSTAQS